MWKLNRVTSVHYCWSHLALYEVKCMILIFDLLQLPHFAIDPSSFLVSAVDMFKFKQKIINEED